MGCADDGADCTEILDEVYEYLDGELDDAEIVRVADHLERCGGCRQQYGLEQDVRSMVARSCTCQHAPEELRRRILATITQIRVTATFGPGGASATISVQGDLRRPL